MTHRDIRTAFDFLLERGYSLIESPWGMVGTVAYRSSSLWIAVEWERSDLWMTLTFLAAGPDALNRSEIDALLSGRLDAAKAGLEVSTPVNELGAFVKERIDAIEQLVLPAEWPRTASAIRQILARRRRDEQPRHFH